MEARFAGGSMGRFVFFGNMWLSEPHVPEKNVPLCPAGGAAGWLSRQMPDLEPTA
jgi:hypothetical protein